MVAPTLLSLQRALQLLSEECKTRRDDIMACLSRGITDEEREWLDGPGNCVDEVALVRRFQEDDDHAALVANLTPT